MNERKTYQFTGAKPGPRVVVFGSLHGDERCGTIAIEDLVREKAMHIKKGTLTLVPAANTRAFAEQRRFCEENLNRVFRKTEQPTSYEATLANELSLYIDEADIFLDLHSFHTRGKTTVFIDFPTPENNAFARALGAECAIIDWPKVYEKDRQGFESYDTTRYAYEHGKIGVLVECGEHQDPASVEHARWYIMRALAHFGLIDFVDTQPLPPLMTIAMERIVKRESQEDRFEGAWEHLQHLPVGTAVAVRGSGEVIKTDKDSIIIFPNPHAEIGTEWFYFGVPVHL